jgi:hypothetical protein
MTGQPEEIEDKVEEFWGYNKYPHAEFEIPNVVIAQYNLNETLVRGMICDLLKLKSKKNRRYTNREEKPQNFDLETEVNKQVLIDIVSTSRVGELHGKFQEIDNKTYNIEDYEYALLRIKEVVKDKI